MHKISRSLLMAGAVAFTGLVSGCGDDVNVVQPTRPTPVVRGITVTPQTLTLNVGEKGALAAAVQADSGLARTVTWQSANPAVATVDANGVVTAVAPGNTTVTASSTVDPTFKAAAQVTVNAVSKGVQSVQVAPPNATITVGSSVQLAATVNANSGIARTVTWTSSNTAVATVDATGKVTAVAPGTAVITAASTADPSITGTSAITVQAQTSGVLGLTVSQTSVIMAPGDRFQIVANVNVENRTPAVSRAVTYSSSNTAVATVDANGVITAVAPGTAIITVTSQADPNVRAAVAVTVQAIATPSVNIVKVTQTVGGLQQPVDLNNVQGQIEVTIQVDVPDGQTVQQVGIIIDNDTAVTQTLTGAVAAGVVAQRIVPVSNGTAYSAGAERVIREFTLSINTADIPSLATGNVRFRNGPHTIRAFAKTRTTAGAPVSAASSTQTYVFRNFSGFIGTMTVSGGRTASDAIGLRWTGGNTGLTVNAVLANYGDIAEPFTVATVTQATLTFGGPVRVQDAQGNLVNVPSCQSPNSIAASGVGARQIVARSNPGSNSFTFTFPNGDANGNPDVPNIGGYELDGMNPACQPLLTRGEVPVISGISSSGDIVAYLITFGGAGGFLNSPYLAPANQNNFIPGIVRPNANFAIRLDNVSPSLTSSLVGSQPGAVNPNFNSLGTPATFNVAPGNTPSGAGLNGCPAENGYDFQADLRNNEWVNKTFVFTQFQDVRFEFDPNRPENGNGVNSGNGFCVNRGGPLFPASDWGVGRPAQVQNTFYTNLGGFTPADGQLFLRNQEIVLEAAPITYSAQAIGTVTGAAPTSYTTVSNGADLPETPNNAYYRLRISAADPLGNTRTRCINNNASGCGGGAFANATLPQGAFGVDNTDPQITAIAGLGDFTRTNDPNATFTVQIQDPASGGAPTGSNFSNRPINITVGRRTTGTADFQACVLIRYFDPQGNASCIYAPVQQFTAFRITDNAAARGFDINGFWTNNFYAQDDAGNRSTISTRTYAVDRLRPVVGGVTYSSANTASPLSLIGARTVTFTAPATDNLNLVETWADVGYNGPGGQFNLRNLSTNAAAPFAKPGLQTGTLTSLVNPFVRAIESTTAAGAPSGAAAGTTAFFSPATDVSMQVQDVGGNIGVSGFTQFGAGVVAGPTSTFGGSRYNVMTFRLTSTPANPTIALPGGVTAGRDRTVPTSATLTAQVTVGGSCTDTAAAACNPGNPTFDLNRNPFAIVAFYYRTTNPQTGISEDRLLGFAQAIDNPAQGVFNYTFSFTPNTQQFPEFNTTQSPDGYNGQFFALGINTGQEAFTFRGDALASQFSGNYTVAR